MPTVGVFLFNKSLAIFAFLIANSRAAATSMSGWLHVLGFAFPLIKIVMWG